MHHETVIRNTVGYVKHALRAAEGGHDWWHIYRVWKSAKHIALSENVDLLTVELAALLHDIADAKFHDGDESLGPKKARSFLQTLSVDHAVIDHVALIIQHISFKNEFDPNSFSSNELNVVRDADRLDAIGAIGIARAFNYGGYKGNPLYNPTIGPNLNMTKVEYKKGDGTTINHFYEKLLLLKDKMRTETGKRLALERHTFMEKYLKKFYAEFEGKE